jgi:hypothetical protein
MVLRPFHKSLDSQLRQRGADVSPARAIFGSDVSLNQALLRHQLAVNDGPAQCIGQLVGR